MESRIVNDILAFLISVILAGIIIPQILVIAFRKKLFDEVDDRKIHKGIVPRLGGIAFFPSILFSFFLVLGFDLKYFGWEFAGLTFSEAVPVFFMICAVMLMFLTGISDDLLEVKYKAKFAVQILAAIIIIMSGVYIDNLFDFLWIGTLPDWVGWIVTLFLIIYVVNAINLIDGIDGLASGLSVVAFVYYTIIFYFTGQYVYSLLAAAAAGTLLPFFYYNVFGNANRQKKIFMGDTGTLTTGMILVFCAIAVFHVGPNNFTQNYNLIIIGLSPLLIPCLDVVRVCIHRLVRHKNPFLPDKSHIHHKLLALGLNQRFSLVVIMLWSMIFIVINLYLCEYMNPTLLIACDAVIWTFINLILSRAISRREKLTGKKLFD